MRRAAFCALALAAVLVQVVLVDGLRLPGGAVPDIALVLVVTAGLTQGPLTGMLTGFVAGIGLDLAPPGGTLIGASALIFCLIGYCCARLSARLQRLAPGLLAVAAIAVGAGEAAQAAAGLIAPGSGVTVAAVRSGLPAAVLYDVVLCAVLLSAAALVRARPWARRPAGQAARSRALASRRARRALGDSVARQGRGAPRGAGSRWDAGVLAFSGTRFRWAPVRAREPVPGSLSPGTFARGRFRRQARMCRRVPRWTGTRSAPRAAGYGRAGGPR